MKLASEKIVTDILIKKSILSQKKAISNVSIPKYDLSDYLDNVGSDSSRFGSKYLFVK